MGAIMASEYYIKDIECAAKAVNSFRLSVVQVRSFNQLKA